MTDLTSEEMLARIRQALRENSRHFAALRAAERARAQADEPDESKAPSAPGAQRPPRSEE